MGGSFAYMCVGTVSERTVSEGTVNEGTVSEGTVSEGMVSEVELLNVVSMEAISCGGRMSYKREAEKTRWVHQRDSQRERERE